MKKIVFIFCMLAGIASFAQDNFTYSPEKPKPGDEVKFTYTPSSDLAGLMRIPEAYVLQFTNKGTEIKDIRLQREYGKLSGSFKTDTSTSTLAFGFTDDGKYDNNQNNGYIIQLQGNDGKPLPKSFTDVASIYLGLGAWKLGMTNDYKRAVKIHEEIFKLYPESKNDNLLPYLSAVYADDKDKGTAAIQKEIENTLKTGLKEEKDYDRLISLYNILRLRQQSEFIKKLKDEKFSLKDKKPGVNDFYEKYLKENELAKKEQILADVVEASNTAASKEEYESFISFLQRNIASLYASKKDWDGFKKFASQITDQKAKANLYNSIAWKMQEDSTNLKLAEELSKFTVDFGKTDWKKPKGEKPKMQRYSEWIKQKENDYATYAMILYRMGNYKKAFNYAKDAQTITKGESVDHNNTYALIAEKSLTEKQYNPRLQQFVKDGKANETIKNILKKLYVKNKKSDVGFDNYIAALEKEAYLKMVADLKKEMLNEAAPQFTLKDLSGNSVSMADIKGKTVVVDFWATWCGPCIASMPGMQKMVHKYKDDPNVKILFVNTWQNEENETDIVKKFIADKGYSDFHVLMDLDDKVVNSFKVDGIPTKFIIGKDGNIKFKDVGFGGEDNLVKKLPAMIDLTN